MLHNRGAKGGIIPFIHVWKERDENVIPNFFIFSLTPSSCSLLIYAGSREEETTVMHEEDHPWLRPGWHGETSLAENNESLFKVVVIG
ncbi:hypothetical protein Lalb_Chr01g0018401 [Lupinus albus]|uniref:Uncharacterized protein n=1 Tax=Lupinus albus TaxID=3870 RepID=A0A6A4R6Z1_LUPAL|nr:hypothetical protein Lalb_Chr01g0018401 [Lupinus albus]